MKIIIIIASVLIFVIPLIPRKNQIKYLQVRYNSIEIILFIIYLWLVYTFTWSIFDIVTMISLVLFYFFLKSISSLTDDFLEKCDSEYSRK
ncbi:MAG: hypothetical protein DRG78_06595 [Epsilonproteobacteria bacterium]|nr:MAG: hypothetical protein DRG78_06595 [Campylobacterota bacterium]